MSDDLQASLQNYVLQLQQVDAALSIDPENEELQILKKDLEEVLALTKDLIKQQLAEVAGGSNADVTDEELLKPRPQNNFQVGDSCMAMSSDDGRYYEGVIEDISEDGEQVSVKFTATGVLEVTVFGFIKPIKKRLAKSSTEAELKNRKQTEKEREYQKKRKLKKQIRFKQIEEEREVEKNKWLAFSSKKKGGTITKKSIFASPDSVTGRVGIGTCGVSGLPMTEYSQAEKRKKGA